MLCTKKNLPSRREIFLFTKLFALLCGLALLCRLLRGFTFLCHGGCELKITADMSTRLSFDKLRTNVSMYHYRA